MNPIDDAIAIWKEGVAAVEPRRLVFDFLANNNIAEVRQSLITAPCIRVVGAGKAGAAMAQGFEDACADLLDRVSGIVNVPDSPSHRCRKIKLHESRPVTSNFPTEAGIRGSQAMLRLFSQANSSDFGVCLLSGGGSALMPAPAPGISLDDKVLVTKLLHASGATIHEVNCVRKHISIIKGGRLASSFQGRKLLTLILSDVLLDSTHTIGSGPTVEDPTTFQDALLILQKNGLCKYAPGVCKHLEQGIARVIPETPKQLPTTDNIYEFYDIEDDPLNCGSTSPRILNWIVGRNYTAAMAAKIKSWSCGSKSTIHLHNQDGEARNLAVKISKLVRGPHKRPKCILFGGETTVTLGPNPGKGGRNQEFVLAMLCELGLDGMKGVTILSGGTDGEDGPTDAAGAIGTEETLLRARSLGLNPRDFLDRHDSYHFFEATGGLFKTGLTGTNVMDLGVILLH